MKSTTQSALVLTLFMFLLVLLAAFFFVFQGQLALRDNLADANQEVDALLQDQAKLELERSALAATSTQMHSVQATSAAENVELSTQLAEDDLTVTAMATRSLGLAQERDAAQATRDLYESTGPAVKIIELQPFNTATVGEQLAMVIVASDVVDVKSVTMSIDDKLIDLPPVSPEKNVAVRYTWVPESAGQTIITVSAVNSNNITSRSEQTTVQVQNPTPTATPTSTATATPTPQATPTS
jgi:hypothetical protein